MHDSFFTIFAIDFRPSALFSKIKYWGVHIYQIKLQEHLKQNLLSQVTTHHNFSRRVLIEAATPDTIATMAKTPMMPFFQTTQWQGLMSLPHLHTVSTRAGSSRPMTDRHTAPTNSRKSSSLGTALARQTGREEKKLKSWKHINMLIQCETIRLSIGSVWDQLWLKIFISASTCFSLLA